MAINGRRKWFPGDQFDIIAGCDKLFSTCKSKFSNALNFQGFPHIPGDGFALSHAGSSSGFDGKTTGSVTDCEFGNQIVTAARRWLGTPYVHQATTMGSGTDCLGLIRGVWREVVGIEPENAPDYSPDWGEVSGNETMLNAANRWFVRITIDQANAGDLILFRWKQASVVRHAGILTEPNRFIHAYEKAGVVESTLGSQWRTRIAAAFQFPKPTSDRQK